MKDFKNELGGHPLQLDDLNQIKNATFERLAEIIKGLTNSTFVILDGLVLSGGAGARTWTAGTVYFNGLFYTMDEQTTPIDTNSSTLTPTYVPDGDQPVIYENGSSVNVRGVQKLTITAGGSNASSLNDANRLERLLSDYLVTEGGLMSSISDENLNGWTVRRGWSNLNDAVNIGVWNIDENVQYRILDGTATGNGSGQVVELRGQLNCAGDNGTTDPIVFGNLFPNSIRPNFPKNLACPIEASGDKAPRLVITNVTNDVSRLRDYLTDGTSSQYITFDNMKYWIR